VDWFVGRFREVCLRYSLRQLSCYSLHSRPWLAGPSHVVDHYFRLLAEA
jgi:hypothetical protein